MSIEEMMVLLDRPGSMEQIQLIIHEINAQPDLKAWFLEPRPRCCK